jgi:regulator of RNase E activity RraB
MLQRSEAIERRLKEFNVTDEAFEVVERVCYEYINLGVEIDDPEGFDGEYAMAHVCIGFEVCKEAHRSNKSALWARDGAMLYFFVGDENEILEKLK